MKAERPPAVVFFRTEAGNEPVREWLKALPGTIFRRMNKRKHRGSDLRDFLQEEGLLEEVEARALKRAIALQLDALRKSQTISKSALAGRMKTSRAAIDRLLDASNPSVTLLTLQKAAKVFNRKLKVELVEA